MAIDFKLDEIKDNELRQGTPFVGYFNPHGELINYNGEYGGDTHYSWNNPVSKAYLKYISYIITGETKDGSFAKYLKKYNPKQYREMATDHYNELIYRGFDSYFSGHYDSFSDFYKSLELDYNKVDDRIKENIEYKYDKFKLDLLKFFLNAYRYMDFVKSTGKITRVDREDNISEKVREEYKLSNDDHFNIDRLTKIAVYKEILSGFKDICVQYLGYDTIERFTSDGSKIVIPSNDEEYDEFFYKTPRVITSSSNDIYDRFYNYILMDWDICKVPRYKYNEQTGIYEVDNDPLYIHKEEKDEEIKEEIQSIKKLVPPNERNRFFKR